MKKRISLFLIVLMCGFLLFGSKPKIALVLSGGGAKGLAHIAVLEAIEQYGIPIDMILGTSMGSLVGSLYATGYSPKEIRALAQSPNFFTMFLDPPGTATAPIAPAFEPTHSNVFTLGFSKKGLGSSPGLLSDQKVMGMLSSVFSKISDDIHFDDLPIPFRCISADVVTGEKIVHEEGSLITAVRSSISIPLIFTPYPQGDGRFAIDGGIVDNLPIQLAKDLGYDIVIACDVNAMPQKAEDVMGSLTNMALQTMTLVSQGTARAQRPLADLLITPEMPNIYGLDFTKYEQIIALGEEACEAEAEGFRVLAERIGKKRDLVVQDRERDGLYLAKEDPSIGSIEIVDLSLFPSTVTPHTEHFAQFVGRPLDELTKQELLRSLDLVKKHYRLASATYRMETIREGEGNLVIYIQSLQKSESTLSLGLSATTGISNNTANGAVWFSADARMNARISNIFDSNFSFAILATIGQTAKVKTSLIYPFKTSPNTSLDLDFSLAYEGGGFSPVNSLFNAQRVVSLDKGFRVDLSLDFMFLDYGRLDFGGMVELISLHDPRFSLPFFTMPSLYSSLVWDTQLSSFAASGIRGEFLVTLGLFENEEPVFGLQSAWRQRFALNESSTVGYDIYLAMMRLPYPLLSSYVDIGALSAFPGYSAGSLKRDVAMVGLLYQYAIDDFLGFGSFLQLALKGGITDTYDPYSALAYQKGPWLSSAHAWDAGASIGFGLITPLGDIILRLGTSILGNVALTIEIL